MARAEVLPNSAPSPRPLHIRPQADVTRDGIEVREEQLGMVKAQRIYQMRCACGRPWFEIELPALVECPACARRQVGTVGNGIEVHEEQLGMVKAQRLYQLSCECGRQWFGAELPKIVQCPSCAKMSVVST
jgi:transcription elongation factor Elf1